MLLFGGEIQQASMRVEGNDDENSWQVLLFENLIKYVRSATTPLFSVI